MSDDHQPRHPREPHLSDAPTGQLRAASATGNGFTLEAAGLTDKGRVRPGNEDAWGMEPTASSQARARGTLLMVADGMGGHAAGEVASALAIETVQAAYYRERKLPVAEAIRAAITTANTEIYESAQRHAERSGMGCTIVAMVVQGDDLTVGHVGDSRGYLIRNGRALQLTSDHSWVAMQVAEGILTPEQAEHHPNRSLLMRALGRQPSVEIDIGHHRLQAGDVLLICSDGLTGVVEDAEIADYASRYAPSVVAEQLVSLANQRGAPDNVTVVAAAVSGPAGIAARPDSAATTVIVSPSEARTPRLTQPAGDAPTIRAQPNPSRAAGAAAGAPRAAGAATAAGAPVGPRTPPGGTPAGRMAGTPVVLSRESMTTDAAAAPSRGRSGWNRWLIGGLSALGIVAAFAMLTLLRADPASETDAGRTAEVTPATSTGAASKPAATPTASGQPAAVPPPVATGIPGMTPPAAAAPPPAAAPAAAPPSAGGPAATPAAPAVSAGTVATPTRPPGSPPANSVPGSIATPTPSGPSGGAAPSGPVAPGSAGSGPTDSAAGAPQAPGAAPAPGSASAPPATDGAPAATDAPPALATDAPPPPATDAPPPAADAPPPPAGDGAPADPAAADPNAAPAAPETDPAAGEEGVPPTEPSAAETAPAPAAPSGVFAPKPGFAPPPGGPRPSFPPPRPPFPIDRDD